MAMPDDVTMVAMSGGVDSSVAAALVAASGRRAVGVSLRLYDAGAAGDRPAAGRCCSPEDFRDARLVAGRLGIPFYVLDYERKFQRSVLSLFVDEYRRGRTPSPCVVCNTEVKFGSLLDQALSVGASRVATGHYARIRRHPEGRVSLHAAIDASKDQSYFLFELDQRSLARAEFPVGEMTKAEVRAIAAELGLPVASKPDSQDICFVAGGDYREVLRRTGGLGREGSITTKNGHVLGGHGGVAGFTVGQRRGLGTAAGRRLYVLGIDASEGTVVVGTKEDLMASGLIARRWNWISGSAPAGAVGGVLKIRHRHPGCEAVVEPRGDGTVTARFAKPQRAVAPGQAAVLYQGTEVLGGGWIESALP